MSREGEALDLPDDLCSDPHLWSRAYGGDQKNEVADTGDRNELPLGFTDGVSGS